MPPLPVPSLDPPPPPLRVDRFFAQHSAILYYWILIVLFTVSGEDEA